MNTFLIKTSWFALIGTIPFLVVLIAYAMLDPFKVVKRYDPLYQITEEGGPALNRNYVGTVAFLRNYEREAYNSFVFGNSRSYIYEVDDWKKHLPLGANCFHYNAPAEALYTIAKKLEFIDKKGLSITNVLLIIDHELLTKDQPDEGYMFMIAPQLVDYENVVDFHCTFLKAFLTPKFFRAYIDFKLSGKIKPYMSENLLLVKTYHIHDIVSNELRMDYYEDMIERGEFYTSEKLSAFYERDSIVTCYPQVIGERQNVLLSKVYSLFEKHNTDFKVIIGPAYDQKKLNPQDVEYLKSLFGEQRVFDFSGKNQYTDDYRKYYEPIHYRPEVARDIMDEIYSNVN